MNGFGFQKAIGLSERYEGLCHPTMIQNRNGGTDLLPRDAIKVWRVKEVRRVRAHENSQMKTRTQTTTNPLYPSFPRSR
jgi:hypothetical protein